MKKILRRTKLEIPSGSYRAHILTVVTGTTIAQGLSILASPIISRLYTPYEFGVFADFTSIATIIAIIAAGRYELAIMLPEKDSDSIHLLVGCILIAGGLCAISGIFVWLGNDWLSSALSGHAVLNWMYLLPFTVLLNGSFQSLSYWQNREKHFGSLSVSRVLQSGMTVLTSLTFGIFKFGAIGLIAASLFGRSVATVFLGRKTWAAQKSNFSQIQRPKLIENLKAYKAFPLLSGPADFINILSNQLPVILLTGWFGSSVAGNYSLTLNVLAVPIALISVSVFDVFKERAASDYRKFGNCRAIYAKTFKFLFLGSLVPFGLLFFFAPELFSFVFGENWRSAGEYTQILSMMYFLRFAASPLSYVLYIANKQFYDLLWQISLLILTVSSLFMGHFFSDVKIGLMLFSASYSMMYVIYLLMSFHFSNGPVGDRQLNPVSSVTS